MPIQTTCKTFPSQIGQCVLIIQLVLRFHWNGFRNVRRAPNAPRAPAVIWQVHFHKSKTRSSPRWRTWVHGWWSNCPSCVTCLHSQQQLLCIFSPDLRFYIVHLRPDFRPHAHKEAQEDLMKSNRQGSLVVRFTRAAAWQHSCCWKSMNKLQERGSVYCAIKRWWNTGNLSEQLFTIL